VIVEYLDERYPHPSLLPVYPAARANSHLFMCRIQADWCSLVDKNLDRKTSEAVCCGLRLDLQESLLSVLLLFAENLFPSVMIRAWWTAVSYRFSGGCRCWV